LIDLVRGDEDGAAGAADLVGDLGFIEGGDDLGGLGFVELAGDVRVEVLLGEVRLVVYDGDVILCLAMLEPPLGQRIKSRLGQVPNRLVLNFP